MDRPNLFKAISSALRGSQPARSDVVPESVIPQEHEAYVNEPLEAWGVYNMMRPGVPDKTGITMQALRNMSTRLTPLNACISTRVNQGVRFAQRWSSSRYGILEEPSFRVRLKDREASPTPEDKVNIRAWEDFFEMGGWCPPPEQDRPIGWQKGLDYPLKQLLRDTYTIDYIPVKLFAQKGQEKQFPVVSFCLDDGALYRNAIGVRELDQRTGQLKLVPYEHERHSKTKKTVRLVRLMGDSNFIPVAEYTAAEVELFIRNPRADERCLGYGFPEVEQALDAISDLLEIRRYNSDRFRKDRLPRGFFKLQAKISPTARNQFENRILGMMTGKSWGIPILHVDPPTSTGGGTDIEWVDLNMMSKDGEYAQLAYTILTEVHAAMHISMEETGMGQASPFSAPMSEASPEAVLKHSQSQFGNLMIDIQNFFNRHILWKSPGGKNYIFEWVGLGDRNYLEEEQLATQMLQNGTINLRMLYKYRDIPLPRSVENHPAVDLPMPFAEALQYLDQKEQEAMQNELMEKQQNDAEAEQEAQVRSAGKVAGGSQIPSRIPNPSPGGTSGPGKPTPPLGGIQPMTQDQPDLPQPITIQRPTGGQ